MAPIPLLFEHLDLFYPLPEPARSEFGAVWRYNQAHKGQHLLRDGTVSDYLYFIASGVVRLYYHKQDREVTEWLAPGPSFFFSIQSFFERKPSHLAIHVIENAEIMALHHDDLMWLCERRHEVEKLLRRMVTKSLLLSQIRMESIQFETAQQRYQRLIEQNPDIVQRVPLAYIASFLGITQETLSRVRGAR
jgi:CRP-like cAMP-binding protein